VRRWLLVTVLLGAAVCLGALSAAGPSDAAADAQRGVVASVVDGDTLTLRGGRRVRLVQIDAPELGGECYSRAARTALLNLAPLTSEILLEADPALDSVDGYGRILRYIWRGGVNVNVELVRRGAAAPYFFRGQRGKYAAQLLAAAVTARAARRGLWGASPRTRLDPDRPVETGKCGPEPPPKPAAPSATCDPNYAGGCVPPYPPDVDCADIRALGIAPVRVIGADVHRLDGGGDGLGCE
jgi:endonuclease YncB( thermonuclease family)